MTVRSTLPLCHDARHVLSHTDDAVRTSVICYVGATSTYVITDRSVLSGQINVSSRFFAPGHCMELHGQFHKHLIDFLVILEQSELCIWL